MLSFIARFRFVFFLLVAVLLSPLLVSATWAQQAATQQSDVVDFAESLTARLDQVEATLGREGLEDQNYSKLREDLLAMQGEAIAQKEKVAPLLQDAQLRLDALQPEKTEGDAQAPSESDALVEKRDALQNKVADLDGQMKLISASLVRITQLNNKITLARQERFTTQLLERNGTMLNPLLWGKGLPGLV